MWTYPQVIISQLIPFLICSLLKKTGFFRLKNRHKLYPLIMFWCHLVDLVDWYKLLQFQFYIFYNLINVLKYHHCYRNDLT